MAQVHAINTLLLLNSVKVIHAMKVLFNIVALLLVWQITSPARPRTCLAKAKDLTFKAKAKDSKFVLEDISRPRTKDQGQAQQHCLAVVFSTYSTTKKIKTEWLIDWLIDWNFWKWYETVTVAIYLSICLLYMSVVQAYFKWSKLLVLNDSPVSSYGRARRLLLTDSSDHKQRRHRWDADLAKAAISCSHVHTYRLVSVA